MANLQPWRHDSTSFLGIFGQQLTTAEDGGVDAVDGRIRTKLFDRVAAKGAHGLDGGVRGSARRGLGQLKPCHRTQRKAVPIALGARTIEAGSFELRVQLQQRNRWELDRRVFGTAGRGWPCRRAGGEEGTLPLTLVA